MELRSVVNVPQQDILLFCINKMIYMSIQFHKIVCKISLSCKSAQNKQAIIRH